MARSATSGALPGARGASTGSDREDMAGRSKDTQSTSGCVGARLPADSCMNEGGGARLPFNDATMRPTAASRAGTDHARLPSSNTGGRKGNGKVDGHAQPELRLGVRKGSRNAKRRLRDIVWRPELNPCEHVPIGGTGSSSRESTLSHSSPKSIGAACRGNLPAVFMSLQLPDRGSDEG